MLFWGEGVLVYDWFRPRGWSGVVKGVFSSASACCERRRGHGATECALDDAVAVELEGLFGDIEG